MRLEHLCLWVFAGIVPIFSSYYAISESPGASALAFSHLSCTSVTDLTILHPIDIYQVFNNQISGLEPHQSPSCGLSSVLDLSCACPSLIMPFANPLS